MTCTTVELDNGTRAIVCTGRKARARCAGCDGPAARLCDWKVKSRRSGTCDTPVCSSCSHSPAPKKDLCPAHRDEWLARCAAKAKAA